jgi:hypothetical protein
MVGSAQAVVIDSTVPLMKIGGTATLKAYAFRQITEQMGARKD